MEEKLLRLEMYANQEKERVKALRAEMAANQEKAMDVLMKKYHADLVFALANDESEFRFSTHLPTCNKTITRDFEERVKQQGYTLKKCTFLSDSNSTFISVEVRLEPHQVEPPKADLAESVYYTINPKNIVAEPPKVEVPKADTERVYYSRGAETVSAERVDYPTERGVVQGVPVDTTCRCAVM